MTLLLATPLSSSISKLILVRGHKINITLYKPCFHILLLASPSRKICTLVINKCITIEVQKYDKSLIKEVQRYDCQWSRQSLPSVCLFISTAMFFGDHLSLIPWFISLGCWHIICWGSIFWILSLFDSTM